MWAWRKKTEKKPNWAGAARAGLAGASRKALMREALHSLSRDGRADRIGVWLEQDSLPGVGLLAADCLRGMLWDAEGEDTPDEWQKLSLEPPLPQELLASCKSVYQELGDSQAQPSNRLMIGPLVGLRRALDLYLTNRVLSAREALEWGLVTRVVPDAEFRSAVDALAHELAAGPTLAIGSAKRLFHQSTWESLETQMELEAQAIAASGHTEDFRAGVTAFANKQPPTFHGR